MSAGIDSNAIIRMFHVHKYFGAKKALIDITLDISRNELLLINGPSGAGKTTLLKLLYLGERASEGQLLVDGMNLSRIPDRRASLLRRKLGIIFQDYKLIATKTVFDNIALVLDARGGKNRLTSKKVRSVLRTVGMESRRNAFPSSLSGGEQQRVAVARAVVGDPMILLADEPTGSLDEASAAVILDLIAAYHRRGATVIIATHDRGVIERMNGRVAYIARGRIHQPDRKPILT